MSERAASSERSANTPPAASQDLPRPAGDGTSGALWTLLSVFLLLLAMFAYLNSDSSTDVTKAGPVIGSVQQTFARGGGNPLSEERRSAMREALPGEPARQEVSTSFAEELRLRLQAAGPGAGLSDEGGAMQLRLPVSGFFAPGIGALRPEQDHLLDTIAAVLRAPSGARHRVRVTVPAAPGERLDMRRAMAFARALEARGVAAGRLITRVSPLSGSDIVFDFFAERASGPGEMR